MVEIKKVSKGQKEILKNLMEKYNYEFSQYDYTDVNELGLYGFDYLDGYWTEEERYPYFIYVDGNLAGFAMVNNFAEDDSVEMDYAMAEFFIMYKYRKQGLGRKLAFYMFDLCHGKWQVKRHPHSTDAVIFWNKIIDEYTNGNYKLIEGHPNIIYDDGTPADMFYFEN